MKNAAKAFKRARQRLGLDPNQMARALRLEAGRSIRRYEDGTREISGPVSLCTDLLPPLVKLLLEWDGWSEIEILEASGLSEVAADAIIDIRKIVKSCGLLGKTTQ